MQAVADLLKLYGWPEHGSAAHWRGEAGVFLDDARRRFAPSMRRRIDLDDLHATGRRAAAGPTAQHPAARDLPDTCPFTLDTLLAADIAALLDIIGGNPAG